MAPLETRIEDTFRSASSTVTINERVWLDQSGVLTKLENLPETQYIDWATKKAQNELQVWQRSMDPWTAACASKSSFAESVAGIDTITSENPFAEF
mmetsp:Transcript_25431/g.33986  ORF Transcript_25431/g.33986 Transcript_25431/m.33986 type:complete len:96 (+) Transcript_25431:442-729(+)